MRTFVSALSTVVAIVAAIGCGQLALMGCQQTYIPAPRPQSTVPVTPPARVASEQGLEGASCDVNLDCESGICEGLGCGPGQGVCASRSRMCTKDLSSYCGCDGQTFHASGTCPGKRYLRRRTCERPSGKASLPDGASCNHANDCESGICEGQGCGSYQGVCVSAMRACTRDLRAYCGCDGQTFRSSSSCPGRRYQRPGRCQDSGDSGARVNLAVGAQCSAAKECASGICEGQGCGALAGVCVDEGRVCTMDIRDYCGCDGQTFQSSGSCPGQLYSKRGSCESR